MQSGQSERTRVLIQSCQTSLKKASGRLKKGKTVKELTIREATPDDAQVIAEFNCLLAQETESKHLEMATVLAGVRGLFANTSRGRYFVAEIEGMVIGQLMHTQEWSDWRNGDIWWLQSVYVHPDHRGRGVFRQLYQHLTQLAEQTPGIVGLRLYVENENHRAQEVYRSLGMTEGGYRVMEWIK